MPETPNQVDPAPVGLTVVYPIAIIGFLPGGDFATIHSIYRYL